MSLYEVIKAVLNDFYFEPDGDTAVYAILVFWLWCWVFGGSEY